MKLATLVLTVILSGGLLPITFVGEAVVTHSEITGICEENGVMRRDPSDDIKVGDLYYVWYSKGKISPRL